MADPARRRLTTQGVERKQQLLDAAAAPVRRAGLRRDPDRRHLPGGRRRQGPLLLVLRDEGAGVPRPRRRPAAAAPAGPGGGDGPRRPIPSCASARARRRRCASWPPTPSPSPSSPSRTSTASSSRTSGAAPRSTPTTPSASSAAGIDAGLIRDEDPRLLAYAVLATVGWFAHWHRTGRLDTDVDGARRVRRAPGRVLPRRLRGHRQAGAARPGPRSLNAAQQAALGSRRPIRADRKESDAWRSTRSCPTSGWTAAKEIRESAAGRPRPPAHKVKMNW